MNLMAYPSAEAGLSSGLQAGIQTGLAMRKQQQDEKTAEFQKQKYEEQMNLEKVGKMTATYQTIWGNPKMPATSRQRAYDAQRKMLLGVGYDNMPEIDFSKQNEKVEKYLGQLSTIYNDKKIPYSKKGDYADDAMAEFAASATQEEMEEVATRAKAFTEPIQQQSQKENYQMGVEAKPYYPEDTSAAGYFAEGGKAGEKALEAMIKPEKEFTQTKDIHIGGGMWQEMGFNPLTNAYDKPIGQPYDKAALKKAGASSVQVTNKLETEEAKAIGKARGEIYKNIADANNNATTSNAALDELESYLDQVNTGKLTPTATNIAQWAKSFGVEVNPRWDYAQALDAVSKKFALTFRNPAGGSGMPGNFSDQDRKYLEAIAPSLGKSVESNKMIIDAMRKVNRRKMEIQQLADTYYDNTGSMKGFASYLQSYADSHPLFAKRASEAKSKSDHSSLWGD